MTDTISLTQLARRFKKSHANTRAILDAEGVRPDFTGRFNAEQAAAAIINHIPISAARAVGKRAVADTAPDRAAILADLAATRSRTEAARARKLEIENMRAEANLLDKDTVIRAGQHYVAHTRAALLGFGSAVAASLVGLPADQIAQRVTNAMRDLLGRLGDVQGFVLDRELA